MKTAVKVCLSLAVVLGFLVLAQAADEKEKTYKGTMVCGKCTLKVCKKCTNVLQVKEGGKTVDYFIDDKGNKETYHKAICPPSSEQKAEVTGTVSTKDGKKWIKASKVEVK
ncbi:MAG TPA: hypothetical protein VH575_28775 [Gemmataceae bacterium]|jgi:hypothetical protein